MKRILFAVLALLIGIGTIQAQENNNSRRGIALGVDNDTLGYLIASPFDNWYISVGGGAQTFIGNELEKDARFNNANYNFYAEVGKWLIPDMAISLYFRFFDVDGQSKYGEQPFIDWNQMVAAKDYQPFHAHGFILNGLVTLDWVNFLYGYEKGCQKKFHVMTPIGLGYARMFGKQINQNPKIPKQHPYGEGDARHNQELNASCGLLFQYAITPYIDLDFTASIFGAHGHWDWSPYASNNSKKFDFVPTATIGARFNLLKYAYRKNAKTQEREKYEVNHHFLSVNPMDADGIINEIDRLMREIDSLRAVAQNTGDNSGWMPTGDPNYPYDPNQRRLYDPNNPNKDNPNDPNYPNGYNSNQPYDPNHYNPDSYQQQLDSLNNLLNDLQDQLAAEQGKTNAMQELLAAQDSLKLPAVTVYFELDKYYLDYNAQKNLQHFAKKLKRSGTKLKYYIIGAADEQTGTPDHNVWLSQHRCQSVYDMLVNELGINPNQLEMKPIGGIREFEPQELNRVGIVVLEHDEMTKIIEKWARIKAAQNKR